MKNVFLFLITISCAGLQAQNGKVVISTDPEAWITTHPTSDANLIAEGSITVRDKIYAGGDGTILGNPGKAGQVLVSQGANKPPVWKTLNIPDVEENAYYLIYNEPFTDYTDDGDENNEGIAFTGGGSASEKEFTYNESFASTGMTEILGLTKPFTIYTNKPNQVYITFEAVAQINNTAQWQGVDFACGIFVDNQLKGVRRVTLNAPTTATGTFTTYTQIGLIGDLANGNYTAKIGCRRLLNENSFNGNLGIGRAVQNNVNNFMAKTSVKIEVYEQPDMDNGTNIIDFIPIP